MTFYFAVFDFPALWSELCTEATLQQARTSQDANVACDSHMPCTTHRQSPESYDDTKRFLFWQIPDLTQFWKASSLPNPRNGWRYKIHCAFLTKRLSSCQSMHMLPWTETILVHQECNWNERQLAAQLIWHCILTWGFVTYFHGVISSPLIIHSPKKYILGASHEYRDRYLRCMTLFPSLKSLNYCMRSWISLDYYLFQKKLVKLSLEQSSNFLYIMRLLWFECEMVPIGLCVWLFSPQFWHYLGSLQYL